MSEINKLAQEIHQNAIEHGWWDEERSFGDIIALCHSELSEALEEYRSGKSNPNWIYANFYSKDGKFLASRSAQTNEETVIDLFEGNKPEGIATELADCIIRIFDYCGKENIDIENVIRLKHEYNKSRPYRHGNKKI